MTTCPRCRERPRRRVNGRAMRYCEECTLLCARCETAQRMPTGAYCRPCKAEQRREASQPGRSGHASRLRANLKRYGLTPEDFARMMETQGGVCAICGGGPSPREQRLHVDHDHDTGAVRGLLCGQCNRGLGRWRFASAPEKLRRAADYLEGRLYR